VRALRKIFTPKKKEVRRGWRKANNRKLIIRTLLQILLGLLNEGGLGRQAMYLHTIEQNFRSVSLWLYSP
jgi:hypothetical protein